MSENKRDRWSLRIIDASGAIRVQPLEGSSMTIGRSSSVELVLDDPGVSRRHAVLEPAETGWRVRDLGSRNGTAVNGVTIDAKPLTINDVLAIGPFVMRVERPTPEHVTADAMSVVDDHTAQLSRLTDMGRPKIDASQIRGVQQLGRDLILIGSSHARLERLCGFMLETWMQGQHTAVLEVSDEALSKWAVPKVICGPLSVDQEDLDFYLSRSLIESVVRSGEPVLATRSGSEIGGPSSGQAAAVVELSIAPETTHASVIGCPLPTLPAELSEPVDGEPITDQPTSGMRVLYAVLPDRCGTGEWLALASLAVEQWDLAERAWAGRKQAERRATIEAELERARKVQLQLVPNSPRVEGLELALHFEPCLGVAGDYIDVVPMPDGRILLVVMDVCGKGMAAALISSSLHTYIHATVRTLTDTQRLMDGLNRYLCKTLADSSFVTGIALMLDPKTGHGEAVNAGHPPCILAKPDGTSRFAASGENPPLGIIEDPPVGQRLMVQPDEVLTLYTDGLSELFDENGQWIGHDGLADEVAASYKQPADPLSGVASTLNQRLAVIQNGRPPDDDMTFLLARRA